MGLCKGPLKCLGWEGQPPAASAPSPRGLCLSGPRLTACLCQGLVHAGGEPTESPLCRQSSSNLPNLKPGQDVPGEGGRPGASRAGGLWVARLPSDRQADPEASGQAGPGSRPSRESWQVVPAQMACANKLRRQSQEGGGGEGGRTLSTQHGRPARRATTAVHSHGAGVLLSASLRVSPCGSLPPHRNPQTDAREKGQGPGLTANPEAGYSEQGQSL